jgi:L-threonylcarbamoyladenylate synthase
VIVSSSQLDDAVAALERGEVVGIPTDTVYGIVTLPRFSDRLYEVKGRPRSLELPILIAETDDAKLSPTARRLAERFWPGKLTIVSGGVGYRVPDHDAPRELARRVGPLASTSANLHGEAPAITAAQVGMLPGVSLVIDGGDCHGAPSTVVRVNGAEVEVLREGAIPSADLNAAAAG